MTLPSSHSCQVELGHCCCGVHASGARIGQASIGRNQAAMGLQKVWVRWPDTALSVVRGSSHLLGPGLDPCVPCNSTQHFATLCPTAKSHLFTATDIAGQQTDTSVRFVMHREQPSNISLQHGTLEHHVVPVDAEPAADHPRCCSILIAVLLLEATVLMYAKSLLVAAVLLHVPYR